MLRRLMVLLRPQYLSQHSFEVVLLNLRLFQTCNLVGRGASQSWEPAVRVQSPIDPQPWRRHSPAQIVEDVAEDVIEDVAVF